MKKNVGSQVIGVQMVSATDGSAFTGTVTVVITGDGGTQGASGGTGPTHEGNGYHTYIPTQAETNYGLIGFTFTGSGAVPVTVQVFTTFPQTTDAATKLSAIQDSTDIMVGTAGVKLDVGTDPGMVLLTSGVLSVNAVQVSGDSAAADNLELAFDGGGYAFTGCTIPSVVGAVGSVVGHTVQTGDTYALANGATGFVAIDTVVDTINTNVGTAQLDLDAITAADGVVVGPTAVASIFSTTAITEAYAADGAAGTPAQLLYLIQQSVTEFAFVSTTKTANKLDGSTTAATFTLDDAANPTSSTRAT